MGTISKRPTTAGNKIKVKTKKKKKNRILFLNSFNLHYRHKRTN